MHIDHTKLVELLSEALDTDSEEVQKQIEQLVQEIRDAIQEGDAYEVNGLGVFSGIGNNIIFIPSDELTTEINYKYVGMEPIEIDAPESAEETEEELSLEEEPLLQDSEPESESEPEIDAGSDSYSDSAERTDDDYEDPFAALMAEAEEHEAGEDVESLSSLEAELSSQESETPEDEGTEEQEDDPFDLLEDSPEELESVDEDSSIEAEIEDTLQEGEEADKPGPDKWGIDTYKDDKAEGMFSGLLGEVEEEDKEEAEPIIPEEDSPSSEMESDTSFDDPFDNIGEDEDDDETEFSDEEEIVPVITNLASEGAKKESEEEDLEEMKSKDKERKEKKAAKKKKKGQKKKGAPVMLWLILIILLLGGGTYGLGYYGIISLPGVQSHEMPVVLRQFFGPPATPPTSTPPATVSATPANEPATSEERVPPVTKTEPQEETVPKTEQPARETEQESGPTVLTQGEVPADQPQYGLKGVSNPASNDGFTIVIYSLSKRQNAIAKQNELTADGYRVLVVEIPSKQYGKLWRVSLGQFSSLRDAAIAAEKLPPTFLENYFITKIK